MNESSFLTNGKSWDGSVENFKIQMKRSGGQGEDSSMRSKTTNSRDSSLCISETIQSHTQGEEFTCAGKEGKLTREERLAIWKAQKQASAGARSKKKSTDLPLMDLTSSQLNSGSSYSLSTHSSSILNVPAHADARLDNKRHCAPKRVARRDSELPSSLDKSSRFVASSHSMPGQSEHLDEKESSGLGTVRPEVLSLMPDVDGCNHSNEELNTGVYLPDAKQHHHEEYLESAGQVPTLLQEYGSGELLSAQTDEPSVEMLKLQLYDQNNRLLKCTNLLKQLLSEQDDLCNKLIEYESLKGRFAKLENTLAEVSLLYQVSQISTVTPGHCEQTTEIRCKMLEEGVTARDREISKLRGRLTSMEAEFKEERERLVAKLLVSEEGKRVAEAALKENDVMWEQLFNTKMTELQAQCADALQLHSTRVHSADYSEEAHIPEIEKCADDEEASALRIAEEEHDTSDDT